MVSNSRKVFRKKKSLIKSEDIKELESMTTEEVMELIAHYKKVHTELSSWLDETEQKINWALGNFNGENPIFELEEWKNIQEKRLALLTTFKSKREKEAEEKKKSSSQQSVKDKDKDRRGKSIRLRSKWISL